MSGLNRFCDGTHRPDLEELGAVIEGWCRRRSALQWGYQGVQRVAVIERYLSESAAPPPDDKLWCFDGRVRVIAVDQQRFSDHTRSYFDEQWQQLPVSVDHVPARALPPPAGLEQMIALAQRLSNGIDFVRVDLYDLDGTIKFGELTAYPGGGVNVFSPRSWDRTFGSYWTQRA